MNNTQVIESRTAAEVLMLILVSRAQLKSKVFTYRSPFRSIEELKQRIIEVCEGVTPQEFSARVSNIRIRLGYLREVGGGSFE